MTPAIKKWLDKNEDKFQTPAEREHLVDFLTKEYGQKKSINFSYETCVRKAQAWVEKLNKKALLSKNQGSQETVIDFKDGMRFVHLLDREAVQWEGSRMGHCVASYDPKTIFSLRDENNFPHATIEIKSRRIIQIKGKGNGPVITKYVPYVVKFLEKKNLEVSNSWDMKKLGFIEVDKTDIRVIKATFENVRFFKNQYVYKSLPKIKKGVDILSYDMNKKRQTKWYQRDNTLYFNSIIELIGFSNASNAYKEASLVVAHHFESPSVEEYKRLFLKDESLALNLLNKLSPPAQTWDFSHLRVDYNASSDIGCDELCSFLIEKGMTESALKVYSRFYNCGRVLNSCFPKTFETNFLELKDKILTDSFNLTKDPSNGVKDFSYYAFNLCGGKVTKQNIDLLLKHCPDLDVELSQDFLSVWQDFETMSYVVNLSKDKDKLKRTFLKKASYLRVAEVVPKASLEMLTDDINLTEAQFNYFKNFAEASGHVPFLKILEQKFPLENLIKSSRLVSVDFGGVDTLSVDPESDTMEKVRFVRRIAANLGVTNALAPRGRY